MLWGSTLHDRKLGLDCCEGLLKLLYPLLEGLLLGVRRILRIDRLLG